MRQTEANPSSDTGPTVSTIPNAWNRRVINPLSAETGRALKTPLFDMTSALNYRSTHPLLRLVGYVGPLIGGEGLLEARARPGRLNDTSISRAASAQVRRVTTRISS